jgi:trans-2,3-dihydro-3-hydroxyanthranilate isomerase
MARFFIVDVFTRHKYSGNQLAVVLDDASIAAEERQRIANEMGFSETTFVGAAHADGAFPVRIFTPRCELPYAGHPTLGTARVIAEALVSPRPTRVVLRVPAGDVGVEFDATERGRITPPRPEIGAALDAALVSRALGLTPADIETEFPVLAMKSPSPQAFVPLRTRAAVERARYDESLAVELGRAGVPGSVYLFTRETLAADAAVHARLFAPGAGVKEDAATGSAAGSLGLYALAFGYLGRAERFQIEQGLELGRPSRLEVTVSGTPEDARIQVGGDAVIVASGVLR